MPDESDSTSTITGSVNNVFLSTLILLISYGPGAVSSGIITQRRADSAGESCVNRYPLTSAGRLCPLPFAMQETPSRRPLAPYEIVRQPLASTSRCRTTPATHSNPVLSSPDRCSDTHPSEDRQRC